MIVTSQLPVSKWNDYINEPTLFKFRKWWNDVNKNRHIIGELQEFFANNAANYSSSALCKLYSCNKDMFYRFMNDGNLK